MGTEEEDNPQLRGPAASQAQGPASTDNGGPAGRDPRRGRRRALGALLLAASGGLLAAILYPVLRFLSPPETAEATTDEKDAGPVNDPAFLDRGFKIIRFGAEPVIVIRVSSTDYRAFSATCTHLACIVEYRQAKKVIWCNCHNGVYDLQGRNISGPPPRPLKHYKVNLVAKGGSQPGSVVVSRS